MPESLYLTFRFNFFSKDGKSSDEAVFELLAKELLKRNIKSDNSNRGLSYIRKIPEHKHYLIESMNILDSGYIDIIEGSKKMILHFKVKFGAVLLRFILFFFFLCLSLFLSSKILGTLIASLFFVFFAILILKLLVIPPLIVRSAIKNSKLEKLFFEKIIIENKLQ